MCRFFAAISTHPLESPYYLWEATRSLWVQSRIDKRRQQGDGWGLGWFEGGKPHCFRSPRPLYRDTYRLQQAARRARGKVLVGHVRWASNPLKLPRRELIGIAHTQPFVHDRWLFAHNGTLYIPQEVTTALGPWAAWVKGKNDSEVLFYWLMKTFLRRTGMPALRSVGSPDLLRRSLQDLDRIGARCKSRYPLHPYPYHGLNWILTNGRRLYAFCYVNPRGFDKAKALSRRSQPYFQLQVKRTASTLVVASEPLDFDADWRPMRHGELLIAQRTAGRIRSHRFQVL